MWEKTFATANKRGGTKFSPPLMTIATMNILLTLLISLQCVYSIPPACFLSCIAEVSRKCERGLSQFSCICIKEDQIVGCLIDICPFGNFNSARDHFLGSCLEHGKPTITNPYPPPAAWPPPDYEKSLPKMHEPVYRPEPTRIHQEVRPSPTRSIVDHHNPPPQSPHTKNIQQQPIHHEPLRSPPQHHAESNPRTTHNNPTPTPNQSIPDFDPWFDDYDDDFTDSYDPEKPLEWEEMDALDRFGRFIVIRRPINVPKQLRDPTNAGKKRRVVVKLPADQRNHTYTPTHEGRKLVEKFDLIRDPSLTKRETLSPVSSIVATPKNVHLHAPLESHSFAPVYNYNNTSIPHKRTKKVNRKTSPF